LPQIRTRPAASASTVFSLAILLALAILFAPLAALAQASAVANAPLGMKPQNLQVLPKDIAVGDLFALMTEYKTQLGVECGYCHRSDPATQRLDYASDAKPEKKTARIMIAMTRELNSKYLGNLPTGSDQRVSCGTCHRGHPLPPEFAPEAP
jgi:hypothetical protein